METNPFEPPKTAADNDHSQHSITYREINSPNAVFTRTTEGLRNKTRDLAQRVVDEEIGVENIISIVEHETRGLSYSFSVVIWHRT